MNRLKKISVNRDTGIGFINIHKDRVTLEPMTIDGDHVEDIKQFLSKQFKEGNKWVAFIEMSNHHLTKNDLRCFKDFNSLEQFNENMLNHFKPIANVLRKLEPEKYKSIKPVNVDQLKDEISKYPIQGLKLNEPLLSELSKGELSPVVASRTIPEADIHKFTVYECMLQGNQGNESDHHPSLLNYFDNRTEALEYWNDLIKYHNNSDTNAKPYFIMNAEFKDQKPLLVEGIPIRNSAVLLKTAYPGVHLQGKRLYGLEDWQDINNLRMNQPVLAKFNTQNNQLEFYNGKLVKVDPSDRIGYMDLTFFSTKEIMVTESVKQWLRDVKDVLDDSQKQQPKLSKGL